MNCQKVVGFICHRHCHKIRKLEWAGNHPSNKICIHNCKSRTRKIMCSFNRKYKKIIWTQSTLLVGFYVFRIKFGSCSYHFFCFYWNYQWLLPYIHLICHTHCQKIGKFEWAGSHPSNQIYSQLCKTRNRKIMCSLNRK